VNKGINGMNRNLQEKRIALSELLTELNSVVVAYSGGVDSTLLAHLATQVLGDRAIAVTAVSASLPQDELIEAKEIAKNLGIRHLLLQSHELDDSRYLENSKLRCYWCKQEVYGQLVNFATQNNIEAVIDGTNYDDRGDHRPGRKAARANGLRSPLLELGFTKNEIRALARNLDLPNWDKPAMACLSSRIPYGSQIKVQTLEKIASAELILKSIGIQVPLRCVRCFRGDALWHLEYFEIMIANREMIVNEFNKIGYHFVTLDLLGYQMGSFNRMDNN
jgi:uncharacterized protein